MTEPPPGFEAGFDEHRRAQLRRGLALSPRERLAWLEQTVEEMRRLLGRARDPR